MAEFLRGISVVKSPRKNAKPVRGVNPEFNSALRDVDIIRDFKWHGWYYVTRFQVQ